MAAVKVSRLAVQLSTLLVVCAGALACEAKPAAGKRLPPAKLIVWVEIDTLRADALSCYGNQQRGERDLGTTPQIDALAKDALLFERCYSAAPWTVPSIATQFTGRWPWQHGATRLFQPIPEAEETIAERLRAAGWRTAGVSTNFIAKRAQGFAQGFELWDESLALGHEGATGEAAVNALLAECDALAPRDPASGASVLPTDGLFLFALLFEPHWRFEAHAGRRFGPGYGSDPAPYTGKLNGGEDLLELRRERAGLDARDVDFLRGLYLSDVAWADRAVGLLVEGLRARGIYDPGVLVVVADHGEEIMERGWLGHTVSLHEELVHVPWILKLPLGSADERRGARISHAVSSIDLPATLLELAGAGAAPAWESRSLLGTLLDDALPTREHLFLQVDYEPLRQEAEAQESRTQQWGVVHTPTNRKWIVDRTLEGDSGTPLLELYQLDSDPLERTNLYRPSLDQDELRGLQVLRGLQTTALGGEAGGRPVSGGQRGN